MCVCVTERERERSERASQRERECFCLPLATVGSTLLQPVVFSISAHTRTLCSVSAVCLGPQSTSFFHPKCIFSWWRTLYKNREKKHAWQTSAAEESRNQEAIVREQEEEEEDGAPQCSRATPAVLDWHSLQQYVTFSLVLSAHLCPPHCLAGSSLVSWPSST